MAGCLDEFQDVDVDIDLSIVVGRREMSAYGFFLVSSFDVAKVHYKAVHKSVLCLSDVLFVASSACDTIYEIVALA